MNRAEVVERPDLFSELEEIYDATQDGLIRAYQGAVQKRQQVLHSAVARREFVGWLFGGGMRSSRAILFHERIEQCEELVELLNGLGVAAAAHHSQLSKSERKRVLRSFERGHVRAVVAPRTLDEGIDVPDADLGVIVAGSKQLRQRIQRAGRVLRRAPGKGMARVVVLFVERTVEDPRSRQDAFIETLSELGRASVRQWPAEEQAIRAQLEA